jgi:hypothetical protein
LDDYINTSLVDGSPPASQAPPPIARADRPAAGDCPGTHQNWNCYEITDPLTQTLRSFSKRGHKLVQAEKHWSGQYGFTYCISESCQVIPVKYLTRRIRILGRYDTTAGSGGYDFELKTTVDRTSGLITVDTKSYNDTEPDPNSILPEDGDGIVLPVLNDTNCLFSIQLLGSYWSSMIAAHLFYPITGADITELAASAASVMGGENLTLDGDAGGDFSSWLDASASTITDTKFHFKITQHGTAYGITGWTAAEVLVELSNPYYPTDLLTDVTALSDAWSLSDNGSLPWRMDSWRALAVITRRDERLATSPDVAWGYTETDESTGDVLGAPFDLGWPDWSFGFDHATWSSSGGWHITDVGAEFSMASNGLGDNTDLVIPRTATEATSNYHAGMDSRWPGYWLFYNMSVEEEAGRLMIQKGCEVKEVFDSYNPFRPCGPDRWLIDTTKAACVTGIAGSVLTVTGMDAHVSAGDLVGIRATDDVSHDADFYALRHKIFYVSAVDSTTLTLGDELPTSATMIAAAYTAAQWDGLSQGYFGLVGKLRWQYDNGTAQWPSPWAICGRVAVTGTYDEGTDKTTFTFAAAQNLITGDLVAVRNAANAILTDADNLTWTRLADTTGTVDGDFSAGVWLTSNKYIGTAPNYAHAPHYLWNSSASTGNFVEQIWSPDDSTGDVDATPTNTDILKPGLCPVLACTPNADAPVGAYVRAFPESMNLTSCGARWACLFIQYIIDPYWQDPIACADTFAGCQPTVEARTVKFSGTRGGESCPDLPADCSFDIPATPPTGSGWTGSEPNQIEAAWNNCSTPS